MRLFQPMAIALLSASTVFAAAPSPVTVGWSTLKTLTSVKVASPATALNNKQVSIPSTLR